MIYERQRIWHHPEPKPGEPHEPRNTPWPGDILRIHPNGAHLRVVSQADYVAPWNDPDQWVAYVWVKPFLFFWWRRISKYYIISLAEWYNFVGNTDVVHVAAIKQTGMGRT